MKNKIIFIIVFLFGSVILLISSVSNLVFIQDGKLHYTKFALHNETNNENIIPDYSYAGYKGGGVSLPDINSIPIKKVVSPVDGDNKNNIQSAINYIESLSPDENGFRGVLLLKRGLYKVNGTLYIKNSGIVIRGEGQSEEGTIILATQTSKHNLLIIQGNKNGIIEDTSTAVDIISTFVPVGAKSFEVSNTSSFSIGDTIFVKRTPNDFWIDDLGMRQYGWKAEDYFVNHLRTIENINGNTISINIPIVDAIEEQYGGGTVSKVKMKNRISNCGVENIRFKSVYSSPEDENHAWSAIVLNQTENSWVKNVTAKFFAYSCVTIDKSSNFNTIEDCAMLTPVSQITGGRRYSFYIGGGMGNLFQRCYSSGGRHDFVTGARVTGPNVFLDCYSDSCYADIGPHHRWATGTLFDNIRGGQIRVQNRKAMGTGHGWAGAQTMFWNVKSYKADIKVESPNGAMNWGIGCEGIIKNGDGYWEHWNNRVTPRSLYLQQLQDRLGKQAVENITIPEQRNENTIWDSLSNWAGNGTVTIFVPGNAKEPFPANGSNDVDENIILHWKSGMDAASHDVYFGTTNPPPFVLSTNETKYVPGKINENTIYYWRIDEKNNSGITKGEVWNFSRSPNISLDTILVNNDSYVRGGDSYANDNYGKKNKLVVKSNNLDRYVRETFLKFNLQKITYKISNVKLKLKVLKYSDNTIHTVKFIQNDNWDENDITYNSKPQAGIVIDSKTVPQKDKWIEFDVTNQVQHELLNDKVISFTIVESSLNHFTSYYSKDTLNLKYSPKLIISVISDIPEQKIANRIKPFLINQNYPNPFNNETQIKILINKPNNYKLSIYNSLGEKVLQLFDSYLTVGSYTFAFNAENISSGVYYYRFFSGKYVITKKMLYLQ